VDIVDLVDIVDVVDVVGAVEVGQPTAESRLMAKV
jgi:hypothetical protein